MSEKISNIADWRVTLDGKDLTDRLRPPGIPVAVRKARG